MFDVGVVNHHWESGALQQVGGVPQDTAVAGCQRPSERVTHHSDRGTRTRVGLDKEHLGGQRLHGPDDGQVSNDGSASRRHLHIMTVEGGYLQQIRPADDVTIRDEGMV